MKKLLVLAVMFAFSAIAQQFRTSPVDPVGGCTSDVVYNNVNGKLWGCVNNAWSQINTGSITSISGTAGEVTVTGTTTPVISIADAFNLSGHASTAPMKAGTSLPGTCTVGQFYDKTDATAGANLYSCTATNTWTIIGGSGASLPFTVSSVSATLSIANGSPAVYGCNGVNTSIASGTTTVVRLAGSASETLYVGISCLDNHLKLISASNTFTCTPSGFTCDTVTGSAFTDGIIPLASVALTSGSGIWTFGAVTDLRAPLQDDPLTAGTGIIILKSGSTRTISLDTTALTTTTTYDLPAVGVDSGGNARAMWWASSTNPAAAGADNSTVGELTFVSASTNQARAHMIVPSGWTAGAVDFYLYGRDTAGANAKTFTIQTQCYGSGGANSPAFPGSYNATQTLTFTPSGAAGYFIAHLSSLTMTGCSALNILDILVIRTDSATGTDDVNGAYLTFVRAL